MKKFEPEVFATLVDYVISLLIIYKLDFYKYLYTNIYRNIFIPPLKLVCTWMHADIDVLLTMMMKQDL